MILFNLFLEITGWQNLNSFFSTDWTLLKNLYVQMRLRPNLSSTRGGWNNSSYRKCAGRIEINFCDTASVSNCSSVYIFYPRRHHDSLLRQIIHLINLFITFLICLFVCLIFPHNILKIVLNNFSFPPPILLILLLSYLTRLHPLLLTDLFFTLSFSVFVSQRPCPELCSKHHSGSVLLPDLPTVRFFFFYIYCHNP